MGKSRFTQRILDVLPPAINRAIQDLEADFLKMQQSSKDPNSLFLAQINQSLQTLALVLDDAMCEEDEPSLIIEQMQSIEDAIRFIGHLIRNRLIVDEYAETAASPDNGRSFAELFSFYESFVDFFERLIKTYTNQLNSTEPASLVTFLIDFSAYSAVNAQEFVPSSCRPFPVNQLVGLTINENDSYRIPNTLILLLHEIGHYVTPYTRRNLNEALMSIFSSWLRDMTWSHELKYLFSEVFPIYPSVLDEREKEMVGVVRKHLELSLAAADAVVRFMLPEYFATFARSPEILSTLVEKDPFINELNDFSKLLNGFLHSLSNDLNEAIFWPERTSEDDIRSIIYGIFNTPLDLEGGSTKGLTFFEHFCQDASKLFEPGEMFGGSAGTDESDTSLAFEIYLHSLVRLGLNEATPENLKIFVDILVRCLKKSVEDFLRESIGDFIVANLDDAIAHIFWIRVLNIRDYENYWKIMEPLVNEFAPTEVARIKFYGVANAILTEYFNILENGKSQEKQAYTIPPISYLGTGVFPSTIQERVIDDIRYILFIPIAEYLAEQQNIFPEKQLFQIGEDGPVSDEGSLILNLRRAFQNFWRADNQDKRSAEETKIINLFTRTLQ